MVERTATINNRDGIHCRPSSVILAAVQEYADHTFQITTDKGDSDLSSILGLLSLGLQTGDTVTIQVNGPEEEAVADHLKELFETEFDFPPK